MAQWNGSDKPPRALPAAELLGHRGAARGQEKSPQRQQTAGCAHLGWAYRICRGPGTGKSELPPASLTSRERAIMAMPGDGMGPARPAAPPDQTHQIHQIHQHNPMVGTAQPLSGRRRRRGPAQPCSSAPSNRLANSPRSQGPPFPRGQAELSRPLPAHPALTKTQRPAPQNQPQKQNHPIPRSPRTIPQLPLPRHSARFRGARSRGGGEQGAKPQVRAAHPSPPAPPGSGS